MILKNNLKVHCCRIIFVGSDGKLDVRALYVYRARCIMQDILQESMERHNRSLDQNEALASLSNGFSVGMALIDKKSLL